MKFCNAGLCNSSANFFCQVIFSHPTAFPVFWNTRNVTETEFSLRVYHVPRQPMPPLPLFPRDFIQCFNHSPIGLVFTFFIILTDRVIHIVSHSDSDCCTGRLIVDFKDLTGLRVESHLRIKSFYGPVYWCPGNVQLPLDIGNLHIALCISKPAPSKSLLFNL